jgi:glyoxylase I family protein
MLYTGLEHTAIASPDPGRLAQWYVDTLGFVINYAYGGNYFVKAPNGAMLEIIPAEGDPLPAQMKTPGLRHLAVMVSDFDAAAEDLKRKGVNIVSEPLNLSGNRLLFFTDPEGNLLHLIARPAPLP